VTASLVSSVPRGDGDEAVLDFELEVLTDASLTAMAFWKCHLWHRPHAAYGPSPHLMRRFAGRYGPGGIEDAWRGWFAVLTSPEYFAVFTGGRIDIDDV